MKTILILSASPRKGGNSDLLCDQFAKGAAEAGHKVEKVRLAEKKIGYCTGCYACQKLHKCVQKDDANELVEKMLAADVIVLATPVYFYSMDAQLKASTPGVSMFLSLMLANVPLTMTSWFALLDP